jgi:hypothetical protein
MRARRKPLTKELPRNLRAFLDQKIEGTNQWRALKESDKPSNAAASPTGLTKQTSPKAVSPSGSQKRLADEAGLDEEERGTVAGAPNVVAGTPKKKIKRRGIANLLKKTGQTREQEPDESRP